jgi:hypothetical protein
VFVDQFLEPLHDVHAGGVINMIPRERKCDAFSISSKVGLKAAMSMRR